MAWGVGGWLLTPFLQSIGPEAVQALRARVAAGLKTTFASTHAGQVSLTGALRLDVLRRYATQATGGKFLIRPNHIATMQRRREQRVGVKGLDAAGVHRDLR